MNRPQQNGSASITSLLTLLLLVAAIPITLTLVGQRQNVTKRAAEPLSASLNIATSGAVRGVTGDLWADVVIGQRDFGELAVNEIVPYKLNNPGGTIVDRSVSPGRLYVWDSGNSRILGVDLAKCYGQNSPCSADVVIGQPSGSDYGACNQNASFDHYPERAPARSDTLCGIPDGVLSTLESKTFVSMFVDDLGNLYVPDHFNHRVLLFKQPFSTDKSGGKGDSVADSVWGQDDFSGNLCNKTGKATEGYNIDLSRTPPTTSSLCFASTSAQGGGVALDGTGNLWVADAGNHRVVRFPKDASGVVAKTADLVLGQQTFTAGPNSFGSSQNMMHGPTAVRFTSDGKLYVLDAGNKRIVVFHPPFTSGMAANTILSLQQTDWVSGLEVDTTPNRHGLWILKNTGFSSEIMQLDFAGNVLNKGGVGFNAGGSIGIDTDGNILPSIYFAGFDDVYRMKSSTITRDYCAVNDGNVAACDATPGCAYYFCSGRCWQRGTPFEIGCSTIPSEGGFVTDRKLFSPPDGPNLLTNRRLSHSAWVGVATAANQLIASDGRLLFWNDLSSLTNGKPADGYVGASSSEQMPQDGFSQMKSDSNNRIWVIRGSRTVEVYQGPLTIGSTPIKIISSPLPALGGGHIIFTDQNPDGVLSLAPTPDGKFLWLSEPVKHRVFRVRDPLTNPVVDVILGQTTLTGNQCNRGGSIGLNTLCFPGALALDKRGNLYVSDHFLEIQGNFRLLMFAAGSFPDSPTSILYVPPATKEFPQGSASFPKGHTTFEPAFNSTNAMAVGLNGYHGRFVQYYKDPTKTNPSNPADPAYAQPDGELMEYSSWPMAATFDDQDNLYLYDTNRGQIRIYKNPFPPSTPTATTTPTPPTPTPTPTSVPSITPTSKPTPTPTSIPSIVYKGHYHNGNPNVSPTTPLQLYHVTAANTGSAGYTDITLPFSCSDTYSINVLEAPYSGSPYYDKRWSPTNRAVGYGITNNKVRLFVINTIGTPQPNQWVSAEVVCKGGTGTPGTITYKGHYHAGSSNYASSVPLQTYHITAAQTNTSGIAEVTMPFSCDNTAFINVIAEPYSNSPFENTYHTLGYGIATNKIRLHVLDNAGNGVGGRWISGDVFCKGGTHPVGTIAYKGHYHSGSINFEPASQLQLYHITAANTGSTGYAEITLPFSCKDTYSTNILETAYSGSPYYDAKWSPTNRAQGYAVAPNKVRLFVLDASGKEQTNQWVSADVLCKKPL